jgi:hypothetical protein
MTEGKRWLIGPFAGGMSVPTSPRPPVFINLDNVLTLERQGDLTTVVMLGGDPTPSSMKEA